MEEYSDKNDKDDVDDQLLVGERIVRKRCLNNDHEDTSYVMNKKRNVDRSSSNLHESFHNNEQSLTNLAEKMNTLNLYELFKIFNLCRSRSEIIEGNRNIFISDFVDFPVMMNCVLNTKEPLTPEITSMMFRACKKLDPEKSDHHSMYLNVMKQLLMRNSELKLDSKIISDGFYALTLFRKEESVINIMVLLGEKLKVADDDILLHSYAKIFSSFKEFSLLDENLLSILSTVNQKLNNENLKLPEGNISMNVLMIMKGISQIVQNPINQENEACWVQISKVIDFIATLVPNMKPAGLARNWKNFTFTEDIDEGQESYPLRKQKIELILLLFRFLQVRLDSSVIHLMEAASKYLWGIPRTRLLSLLLISESEVNMEFLGLLYQSFLQVTDMSFAAKIESESRYIPFIFSLLLSSYFRLQELTTTIDLTPLISQLRSKLSCEVIVEHILTTVQSKRAIQIAYLIEKRSLIGMSWNPSMTLQLHLKLVKFLLSFPRSPLPAQDAGNLSLLEEVVYPSVQSIFLLVKIPTSIADPNALSFFHEIFSIINLVNAAEELYFHVIEGLSNYSRSAFTKDHFVKLFTKSTFFAPSSSFWIELQKRESVQKLAILEIISDLLISLIKYNLLTTPSHRTILRNILEYLEEFYSPSSLKCILLSGRIDGLHKFHNIMLKFHTVLELGLVIWPEIKRFMTYLSSLTMNIMIAAIEQSLPGVEKVTLVSTLEVDNCKLTAPEVCKAVVGYVHAYSSYLSRFPDSTEINWSLLFDLFFQTLLCYMESVTKIYNQERNELKSLVIISIAEDFFMVISSPTFRRLHKRIVQDEVTERFIACLDAILSLSLPMTSYRILFRSLPGFIAELSESASVDSSVVKMIIRVIISKFLQRLEIGRANKKFQSISNSLGNIESEPNLKKFLNRLRNHLRSGLYDVNKPTNPPAASDKTTDNHNVIDVDRKGAAKNESELFNAIRDRLFLLIKASGSEGILGSELPKKYFEVFGEQLHVLNKSGSKMKIKDIIGSNSEIHCQMVKSQPKFFVSQTVQSTQSATPAAPTVSLTSDEPITISAPATPTAQLEEASSSVPVTDDKSSSPALAVVPADDTQLSYDQIHTLLELMYQLSTLFIYPLLAMEMIQLCPELATLINLTLVYSAAVHFDCVQFNERNLIVEDTGRLLLIMSRLHEFSNFPVQEMLCKEMIQGVYLIPFLRARILFDQIYKPLMYQRIEKRFDGCSKIVASLLNLVENPRILKLHQEIDITKRYLSKLMISTTIYSQQDRLHNNLMIFPMNIRTFVKHKTKIDENIIEMKSHPSAPAPNLTEDLVPSRQMEQLRNSVLWGTIEDWFLDVLQERLLIASMGSKEDEDWNDRVQSVTILRRCFVRSFYSLVAIPLDCIKLDRRRSCLRIFASEQLISLLSSSSYVDVSPAPRYFLLDLLPSRMPRSSSDLHWIQDSLVIYEQFGVVYGMVTIDLDLSKENEESLAEERQLETILTSRIERIVDDFCDDTVR